MKKILFLIPLLIILACKKDDEPAAPVSKDATIEIEYSTLDTEMDIWYNIGNNIVENTHKSTNYFKYTGSVRGAQTYHASIKPLNNGFRCKLLVKFDGDTLFFKDETGNGFSCSGTLPFIQ